MTKKCRICNEYKEESEFNFRKREYKDNSKLVLNSICRKCNSEKSKEYYHKTKNTKLSEINSIFIRKRGSRYIVYTQGKQGKKIKQVNSGSFITMEEAVVLKEELINKLSK